MPIENDPILQQLEKQKEELNKKLQEAKKKITKRETELKNKRALILGKAILAEIEKENGFLQTIMPVIDKHVTTQKDKKMLGLENLVKTPAPKDKIEGQK